MLPRRLEQEGELWFLVDKKTKEAEMMINRKGYLS
jgi:hypothetical protein